MSKALPNGWSVSTLSQLSEVITKGTTPTTNGFSYTSKGVNFLRVENISNGGKIIESDLKFISDEAHASLRRSQLREGDLLISIAGAIGRSAIVERKHLPANTNQAVGIVRLLNGAIENKYVRFAFESPIVEEQINNLQSGMAQINLNLEQLGSIRINLPPLIEQQKIASILTAVDEVIESTAAQINKLKDLKTGMMQELLTKGIGHTEFKDSPVGRIPKGWDCCLLDKVARRGSGHTPDKQTSEYWNGGIKWISLADSSKLDRLYINETESKISELGIKNSSAVLHPKGTVVLSRDAGIGKSAITTDQMAVSQHFIAWICGERLNNHFLYYLLQLWKPRFENIAIGSTIKTIGLQYFKSLEIPVPSVVEQEKIANALLSSDSLIFRLEAKKKSLFNLKKALMQDLLTGKVLVKVNPQ